MWPFSICKIFHLLFALDVGALCTSQPLFDGYIKSLSHQSLCFCEVSDTYLLECLGYMQKRFELAVDVCCCLETQS